jgi:hypothetical protein
MRRGIAALLVMLPAGPQHPDLAPIAEAARRAFASHEFGPLVGGGEAIRLRLPGQRAGAPLRGAIAVAVLEAFSRSADEVEISLVGSAVQGDRQGYVELERRFRPPGAGQVETQRVLLSVRLSSGGWQVVEVWVVAKPLK